MPQRFCCAHRGTCYYWDMRKVAVVLAALLLLAAGGAIVFWCTAKDPRYTAHEILSLGAYGQYDELIVEVSRRYNTEPELIKAIIWRESRFHPTKVGGQGERGLMQITERAAADWAKAEKIETFVPTDLFDPKVNIEAGTWYLSRALSHWSDKDNPIPFALAEYNAGRGRVKRWVKDSGQGETANAGDLQSAMDFPGTKNYIATITNRLAFYKEREEFSR